MVLPSKAGDGFLHPNYSVAAAIDAPLARGGLHDAVKMGGAGMDMGFALVHSLSYALFPDGFGCIGDGCPSNDHSNGDRDYTPHGGIRPGPRCTRGEEGFASLPCTCHDPTAEAKSCSACGCAVANHWHKHGDYAIKQRWL